jgi:hypothetical protein
VHSPPRRRGRAQARAGRPRGLGAAVVDPRRHGAHGAGRPVAIVNLERESRGREVGLHALERGRDVSAENALGGLIAGKRSPDEIVGAGIAHVLRDARIDGAKIDEARGQSALRGGGLHQRGEYDRGGDAAPSPATTNDTGAGHRALAWLVGRIGADSTIDLGTEELPRRWMMNSRFNRATTANDAFTLSAKIRNYCVAFPTFETSSRWQDAAHVHECGPALSSNYRRFG